MVARFASALLLLLGLAWAAPPLAAQDTVPAPELAAQDTLLALELASLPLDSLFARMTSHDADAERAFLEAVRRGSPEEIVPYLHADNDIVFLAVHVLMWMGERGARVLLQRLHAADEEQQRWILSRLSAQGQVARPLAAALLREEDEEMRAAGAELLERPLYSAYDTAADPESEALVLAALADPSANVRSAAVSALRPHRYIYPSEVRALIGLLARDPEPDVREEAALALGSLGHDGAPAVPALIAAMADADEDVRWRSATALGELGPAAVDAVPVLLQAARGTDEKLRPAAVGALGDIGIDPPVQAGPVLLALEQALAHEDSTTRRMAVRALAQLDARAVPLLVRALRDPDERVASWAAGALGRRPVTQPLVDALFAALHHPRPDVGAAAAAALTGIGPAQLPRLREVARAGSQPAARAVHYADQAERLGINGACYAFRRGPWRLRSRESFLAEPPTQVRFLPHLREVLRNADGGPDTELFVAERAGPSAEHEWTYGAWRPLPEPEALELEWFNGFTAVSLELRVEERGTMRGTARTDWDSGDERQTAEVTGNRIPCPADRDAE